VKLNRGIPVVDGVVIGEAYVLDTERYRIRKRFVRPRTAEAAEEEWARFLAAVEAAKAEAELDRERMLSKAGTKKIADVFGFQAALYDDPELTAYVREQVTGSFWSAETAVSRKMTTWRKQFEALGGFMAQRVGDIDDLQHRLMKHLVGQERESFENLTTPVVLIARDLTPAQTARMPLDMVLGFVTERGGQTSHTAIIAQSRRIPAVVGVPRIVGDVTGGETVIIDGREGRVIVDPDPPTLERYRAKQEEFARYLAELEELVLLPAETRDGHIVNIFANIEYPDEIENALRYGAQGIGLYRTEFLYEPGKPEPTEDVHYKAYLKAVQALDGRPLVIRTLDLGADKFVPEGLSDEDNPFLGCRSIRYCLFQRRDVFEAQLRAILRVSSHGEVRIMLPMISSLEELTLAKEIIEDVRRDLLREGHEIRADVPVGIMIEVPSAALMADVLARHADFFSIGTNDLVQYTLAVDRVNSRVAELYQPTHPAVFRLVLHTIEAARRHKIPVSICGELSGEPHFTLPLIGLGMRDLSMASATIPKIKRFIRSISAMQAGRAIDAVLSKEDATECRAFLHEQAKEIAPELYS